MENDREIIKDELTPKEIKGLDIVVKGATKKYPFIKGWELHPDYRTYKGVLFVTLKLNPFTFGEWYGCEVTDFWKRDLIEGGYYSDKMYYSLGTYLDDKCVDGDEVYKIKTEISEKLNSLYNMLPKQYISTYMFTPSFTETKPYPMIQTIIASDYRVDLT